jgi:hypothetical protein
VNAAMTFPSRTAHKRRGRHLLVVLATALIALGAAWAAQSFTLGTTTRCTFGSQWGGVGGEGLLTPRTVCFVTTYTLLSQSGDQCTYLGEETDYVFVGNAGVGEPIETVHNGRFVFLVYAAFRPGAKLVQFPPGSSPNPYTFPPTVFTVPCSAASTI